MKNTLDQLLQAKGHDVWSVRPDATVYHAIHLMAEKEIGALLVLEGKRLVGVISERDYARQIVLRGRNSRDTLVREIMTGEVVTATPAQRVDECLGLMTERRIRHLPVVDGERVVGMISIGDLVKSVLADQQATIDELTRYITGDAGSPTAVP